MATTKDNRVGRTRERLARLLNEAIPTAMFAPEGLNSKTPIYATPQWDCCSWYGDGTDRATGINVHVASWSTMRECVRYGIEVFQDDGISQRSWEVCPKGPGGTSK
jgi:hypothetical protein